MICEYLLLKCAVTSPSVFATDLLASLREVYNYYLRQEVLRSVVLVVVFVPARSLMCVFVNVFWDRIAQKGSVSMERL